jgi:hypothetical protein
MKLEERGGGRSLFLFRGKAVAVSKKVVLVI